MKKLLFAVAIVATLCLSAFAQTDTSYLLVQGPFGAGSATENFMWQVNYPAGYLSTGQDLLTAVFGAPKDTGTTFSDGFGGTYEVYQAGSISKGVEYIYFGTSPFPIAFSMGGTQITMDPSYSPGWNYYVAGGSGANGSQEPTTYGVPYSAGSWTYSNDGIATRTLANDSFDAWGYGDTNTPAGVAGSNNLPTNADFASATVVTVPEPGSAAVLGMGALVIAFHRRRRVS